MKKIIKLSFSLMLLLVALGSQVAFAEDSVPTLNSSDTPPAYGQSMTEAEKKEADKKAKEAEEKANKDKEKVEVKAPASVTGEKYQGAGTVTDFSTSGSKAFYTIKDKDQNVFYLVIDMDKTENNVYFLSDVSKADMAGQGQTNGQSQAQQNVNTQKSSEVDTSKDTSPKKANNNSFTWIVLAIAGGGLIAYYFLYFKKKKKQPKEEQVEAGGIPDEVGGDEDIIGIKNQEDSGNE